MPDCEPIKIGAVIISKYNEHNPRDFVKKLEGMDADALYKSCKDYIWLSSYAGNNPRSDYHWMCDACSDECKKRNAEEIYNEAHDAIARSV